MTTGRAAGANPDIADVSSPSGELVPAPTGPFQISAQPLAASPVALSVVIPTFNESRNVRELVARLTQLLDGPLGGRYELIVVDDDSPDRTWEVAQGLTSEYPGLRVMRRVGERGLSTAVIRGWQAARGDVLAVIDGDLQHPPEVTLSLFQEIERGADMAIASRHVTGGGVSDWAFYRRVVSRGAQLLGLLLLPGVLGRVSDPMSGYFMVKRGAIAGAQMSPVGYKILIEVIGRGSVRWIAEVGYVFCERVAGESKANAGVYADYLRHLVRLRIDSLPIARFARFCAVGLSGVAVDMAVFYLVGDPHRLAWPLVPAKLAAGEVAVLNNFLWNNVWTFRGTGGDAGGAQRPLAARLIGFHVACGLGLVINIVLLTLAVDVLGINRYVANAVAIAIVAVWNFWASKRLVWR